MNILNFKNRLGASHLMNLILMIILNTVSKKLCDLGSAETCQMPVIIDWWMWIFTLRITSQTAVNRYRAKEQFWLIRQRKKCPYFHLYQSLQLFPSIIYRDWLFIWIKLKYDTHRIRLRCCPTFTSSSSSPSQRSEGLFLKSPGSKSSASENKNK